MNAQGPPLFELEVKKDPGGDRVWDPVRRKYVLLTPEERVRQSFMRYLHHEKGHPYGLMEVEKGFRLHKRFKRCDILTRDAETHPFMIVECKAPGVTIDQKVFDQIARYNIAFSVPYLVVTNGKEQHTCAVDFERNTLRFLEELPPFQKRS